MDKFDVIKIKNFSASENALKKLKRQPQNGTVLLKIIYQKETHIQNI